MTSSNPTTRPRWKLSGREDTRSNLFPNPVPELPEVETVMRGLVPPLVGHKLLEVEVRGAGLRLPFPPNFAARLMGRRILRLRRRAKYILADLDDTETLVLHLGMSGRVSVHAAGESRRRLGRYVSDMGEDRPERQKHDHVVLRTDAPATVVYNDARRFGLMTLVPRDELAAHPLFRDLGVEPLSAELTAARLGRAFAGRKTSVKSALLDQSVVAGIGNVYACEILFRARVSPRRRASSVKAAELTTLAAAIKAVLRAALAAGRASLRERPTADDELGMFRHCFQVYDREGLRCPRPRCPGIVRRIVQAGRSTFYCKVCQR
jgi:formamidopyrimidine-DNA glycosylase